MVSTPGYDVNQLAVHDDVATNEAYDALIDDPSRPLLNRAIGGDLKPPGSTFKIVTAAAALASADYMPHSKLPNVAEYEAAQVPDPSCATLVAESAVQADEVTIADALRLRQHSDGRACR